MAVQLLLTKLFDLSNVPNIVPPIVLNSCNRLLYVHLFRPRPEKLDIEWQLV
jgi:hypothetical protein